MVPTSAGSGKVRVLILEPTPRLVGALQREPGPRLDIRGVASVAEAMLLRERPGWRPQAILSELTLPDGEGAEIADALQRAFPGIALLFSTGGGAQARRQLEALDGPVFESGQNPDQRHELFGDLAIVARRAAEQAVQQAVDRLMVRLGLDDEDGVKSAIRLARAYETARSRFWAAVTSGLASGFLIALGVGLVALIRSGQLP